MALPRSEPGKPGPGEHPRHRQERQGEPAPQGKSGWTQRHPRYGTGWPAAGGSPCQACNPGEREKVGQKDRPRKGVVHRRGRQGREGGKESHGTIGQVHPDQRRPDDDRGEDAQDPDLTDHTVFSTLSCLWKTHLAILPSPWHLDALPGLQCRGRGRPWTGGTAVDSPTTGFLPPQYREPARHGTQDGRCASSPVPPSVRPGIRND